MDKRQVTFLALRYFILIVLGLFNLYLFYLIFTPLTVYSVYFLLLRFSEGVVLVSTGVIPSIFLKGYIAQIIPACVAGSAYYLLLILNLTTPMKIKKRIASILFLLISFLIINILRITIFALLVPKGYQYFDVAHEITWYLGSTIMIAIIWFANIMIFKIRMVPIYSDLKSIYTDAIMPKSKR